MVTIYVDDVTEQSVEVAREIANMLKMTVRLVTPTKSVEVHHEEVSEMQNKEVEKTHQPEKEQSES